jgi:hypothetical protein
MGGKRIRLGVGPGVPSEVKVYQIPLASSSITRSALYAAFKPFGWKCPDGVSS